MSEKIADLTLRLNPPSEFLAKCLVLLINGRVSSLIDPPPVPAPKSSSLVKLPVAKETKKRLLGWMESVKGKGDCPLDDETQKDLMKALK